MPQIIGMTGVMKEISLTITGMRHYYGNGLIHVGDLLRYKKESENEYDAEAIRVLLPVYGKVRYIARPRRGKERFEKFNVVIYTRKVVGMFGRDERTVKMLCENNLAGTMIDRFKREVMMHPVSEKHFVVNVTVNVSQQFFGWLVALGKGESPEDVKEAFTEAVEQ